jgi:hypothetical protein
MIGSLPASSAISPQMVPKRGFWFGMLSTECKGRYPQAHTGKCGEKKLTKNTYPASRTNAQGRNDIHRDSANNVRLECRMQPAGYIDGTNR